MFGWRFTEAKNRFVELALAEKLQRIIYRGDAAVVLSEVEYERITGKRPGIVEQFMEGPSPEGRDLTRDKSVMRDIYL